MLWIQVLPKKVKGTLVNAAQAQSIAKGNPKQAASVVDDAYKEAVISYLKELYEGSLFAPLTCDDERRFNPLRTLTVFSL
jgi:hypothetical protein